MSNTVTLSAVGDLMLGDHPVCFGHGIRSTIEKRGFPYLVRDISEALGSSDIVFGNLESVLSDKGYKRGDLKSAELRGRPEDARGLADVGFNVLNVANNHAMQHGVEAFHDTVNRLDRIGIEPIGLADDQGTCRVLYKKINNLDIAILSYSLRPEKFLEGQPPYAKCEEAAILRQVENVVKNFDGPLVVSLHWGSEYLNIPSGDQQLFARKLIDTGCCLVLGHHPHVLQGFENYNKGLIAYSLGNFIFDKWQKNPRETAILNCEISADGVDEYSITPVFIKRTYQPQVACGGAKRKILSRIQSYSSRLEKGLPDAEEYAEMAEKAYLKFRLESYLYFVLHIYRYNPRTLGASAYRFIRRRLGKD